MMQCYVSQQPVMIMNPEGQVVMVWTHVTSETCTNLLGRDLLPSWGCTSGRMFDGATAMKGTGCPTPPIRCQVDKLVWGNQWSLPQDKLAALRNLVQEQLDQGHLDPSRGTWNTLIFCIKKKSGKWRLLQDLQKILGCAGYLQSVFVLTCDCKGKIQLMGKLETVTKMKVSKRMSHRVMTQMQMK
ncbi:hypothetical protein HGM15179_021715 [Zosterops borbonicus]|uniref:Uncharacterized protein n=1 Tax=Zosterops borbonicus TaxID=364589 RepID=A0A8K1FW22_9PASS|nr:hypothetical protein HGM15179_021715 [Zosterops borbonicus]